MLRLIQRATVAPVRRMPARMFSSEQPPQDQPPQDQDVMYVDLNNAQQSDAAAASKHFFEYQTGRWIENDRAERAARQTKFSLKGLLELLKREVNYLEQGSVAIETIEPFFEGKHNKLYKVTLKDRRSYVLRIPYALGSAEYRRLRLLSEVATAEFLSSRVFDADSSDVKIPTPIAYSASAENELETPYILTSFVAGSKLAAEWKPWSTDLEEKKPVIEPMAHIAAQMLKAKFPAYGSLFFAEDAPNGVPVGDDGKFVIGPTTEKRFWKSDSAAPFRGPWQSWQEYLQATADIQLAYSRELPNADATPNLKAAERYAKLVPALFTPEELPGELTSPRLYDPDLSPMNVIKQDNKLWLIDFENTVVKPYFLHGVPWFVRNPGERIYSLEEIPGFDKLPEQDKRILSHFHSLTQTEFAYEMQLRDAIPDLILAHHPAIKRREEIVHRSMQTDIKTGFFNDLDFAIYRLSEIWKALNIERSYPISFSEDETNALASSIAAWNQELMQNKFLESKGFVPADEFDQLLGTGAIVPVDESKGDYKLTQEFLEAQNPLNAA